jgi:hypothetical protein
VTPPRRLALLAGVTLSLLAACPLPQPLPSVGHEDGGTVTPPRIFIQSVSPPETVIQVSLSCPTPPAFTVSVDIIDDDTAERVDARWFVDYAPDAANSRLLGGPEDNEGPVDPTVTLRHLLPVVFTPNDFSPTPAPGVVHVLELVVSNGFYPLNTPDLPQPNRTPQPGYETQVFRWVFQYVATGGRCSTTDPP